MMTQELSQSLDSSRTNSREILEVVLHKKGEEDRHPHHHHHQQQQQSQHHHHPLQQLHQHRSADSSGRLSAMLVRTTHLHHNHLGDLSRAPSSFSRKSLSRQSLDSNSHGDVSDTYEPRDDHHACATACAHNGGVRAFLNSLCLLAVASLILGAMSLLLLASVAQEQTNIRDGDSSEIRSKADAARISGAKLAAVESTDPRGESSYTLIRTSQDGVSLTADMDKRSLPKNEDVNGSPAAKATGADSNQAGDFTLQGQSMKTLTRAISSGEGARSKEELPNLLEAAAAMATLVLVADLCCLMVCCMQCFFGAKLLTMHEGEERSAKYLKECSSSRLIAVMGFFLSIPAFLVALVLVVVVKLHPGSALTSCVVLGVGGLFCVLSVMQNLYHWRVEKTRADEGLPVHEGHILLRQRPPVSPCHRHSPPSPSPHPPPPTTPAAAQGEVSVSQKNELSTLV